MPAEPDDYLLVKNALEAISKTYFYDKTKKLFGFNEGYRRSTAAFDTPSV